MNTIILSVTYSEIFNGIGCLWRNKLPWPGFSYPILQLHVYQHSCGIFLCHFEVRGKGQTYSKISWKQTSKKKKPLHIIFKIPIRLEGGDGPLPNKKQVIEILKGEGGGQTLPPPIHPVATLRRLFKIILKSTIWSLVNYLLNIVIKPYHNKSRFDSTHSAKFSRNFRVAVPSMLKINQSQSRNYSVPLSSWCGNM